MLTRIFRIIAILSITLGLSACGKIDNKQDSKTSNQPAKKCNPKKASVSTGTASSTLAINRNSALALVPDGPQGGPSRPNDIPIPPNPNPQPNPQPNPVNPCLGVPSTSPPGPGSNPPFPNPTPIPTPGGNKPPPEDECVEEPVSTAKPQNTILKKEPNDSLALEPDPDPPARAPADRCASDATQLKNIASEGVHKKLGLNWKVLSGLKTFVEAKTACAALGSDYHLAETTELDALLQDKTFQNPVEVNCSARLWADQFNAAGTQCVAQVRSFKYVPENPNNPLPINASYVLSNTSKVEPIVNTNSALCISGTMIPTMPCGSAVANLLSQNRLGLVDQATGLTWAPVTVKTFDDADQLAAQCALGAADGWRIPTYAELQAAILSDLFKTKAYRAADTSCPLAWNKPADGASPRSCVKLGGSASGTVPALIDTQCNGAAVGSAKPLGLCVKDKK